jgi:MFS family permease
VFAAFLVVNSIFAAAILTATMAVMAATATPERRGAVLGQIMFPFYVGGIVGPPIGNLAFHVGQGAVFAVAAVLSLAPLVVMLTLRPAVAQPRAA